MSQYIMHLKIHWTIVCFHILLGRNFVVFTAASPVWLIIRVQNKYLWKKGREWRREIKPAASFEINGASEWSCLMPVIFFLGSTQHPEVSCWCSLLSEVCNRRRASSSTRKISKTEDSLILSPYTIGRDQMIAPRRRYSVLHISVLISNYYMFFLLQKV